MLRCCCCGIGRRDVVAPLGRVRVCVGDSNYEFQGDRSLLRRVVDVVSVLGWPEVCGLVLGRGNRGRRLGRRVRCCWVSWVEIASHVDVHNGRLHRVNVILTWRRQREMGGGFDCYVSCGCNMGGVFLGEGDVLPMCFLARLGWLLLREG
jgi:hypothetical protein